MATADDVAEFEANPKTIEARRARESLVVSRRGNYSLFCLSEQNCVRRAATVIVESRYPLYIYIYIIFNAMLYSQTRASKSLSFKYFMRHSYR